MHVFTLLQSQNLEVTARHSFPLLLFCTYAFLDRFELPAIVGRPIMTLTWGLQGAFITASCFGFYVFVQVTIMHQNLQSVPEAWNTPPYYVLNLDKNHLTLFFLDKLLFKGWDFNKRSILRISMKIYSLVVFNGVYVSYFDSNFTRFRCGTCFLSSRFGLVSVSPSQAVPQGFHQTNLWLIWPCFL